MIIKYSSIELIAINWILAALKGLKGWKMGFSLTQSTFIILSMREMWKILQLIKRNTKNLMKLYIFHIISLTIKTCAPLVEGEMLKTI